MNVLSLYLPPLRERREDIPLLAEYFLSRASKPVKISSAALQSLIGYSWPGNVRELQNTIERAAVMAENGLIQIHHIPNQITGGVVGQAVNELPDTASIDDRLQEIERKMIIAALIRADGIQVKAAQILGIKERSLWHRIKKYDIDVMAIKKST